MREKRERERVERSRGSRNERNVSLSEGPFAAIEVCRSRFLLTNKRKRRVQSGTEREATQKSGRKVRAKTSVESRARKDWAIFLSMLSTTAVDLTILIEGSTETDIASRERERELDSYR